MPFRGPRPRVGECSVRRGKLTNPAVVNTLEETAVIVAKASAVVGTTAVDAAEGKNVNSVEGTEVGALEETSVDAVGIERNDR